MTVTTLIQPVDAAAGRNRKLALGAISKQLEKLRNCAEVREIRGTDHQVIETKTLSVSWYLLPARIRFELQCCVYFQIRQTKSLVMSGYIYPIGLIDVMTWKRGFEAALFEDFGKVLH